MKRFRRYLALSFAVSIFVMAVSSSAFALDGDDEIKPDDPAEKIAYEASSAESAKLEAKYPAEAKEVREALARHLEHAKAKDIEAYMADFIPERVRYPELDRAYTQRAMDLRDLKLEIHAIEFAKLTRNAATVHTRQITSYTSEDGQKRVDDAIISYRWIKDTATQTWRIAFTERRRLVAGK